MYAYTTYIFLYTKRLKNTKLLRKIVCTPLQNVHSTSIKLSYLKTLLPASDSWEEGRMLAVFAGISHFVPGAGCTVRKGSWPTGLENQSSRTYQVETFAVKVV